MKEGFIFDRIESHKPLFTGFKIGVNEKYLSNLSDRRCRYFQSIKLINVNYLPKNLYNSSLNSKDSKKFSNEYSDRRRSLCIYVYILRFAVCFSVLITI